MHRAALKPRLDPGRVHGLVDFRRSPDQSGSTSHGHPETRRAIPIRTISRWATKASRPGLVAALNGDFFLAGVDCSAPQRPVVHNRSVLWFGAGTDEQAAGYAPRGRVVLGVPELSHNDLTFHGRRSPSAPGARRRTT